MRQLSEANRQAAARPDFGGVEFPRGLSLGTESVCLIGDQEAEGKRRKHQVIRELRGGLPANGSQNPCPERLSLRCRLTLICIGRNFSGLAGFFKHSHSCIAAELSWREARLSYGSFLGVERCSPTVKLRRLY